MSVEGHEDGKQRMLQAGASGINWVALAEWTLATPRRTGKR